MARLSIFTYLVLLLSGCMTVGPDYEQKNVLVPDSWTAEIVADNESAVSGSVLWWYKFGDPVLNRLIQRARIANPNINIAEKRATEGWHQRKVLEAALYPKVDLFGRDEYGILTYDKDYIDIDPGASHGNLSQVQFGWDLDIFGKTKRGVEAAGRNYESKVEAWRDVMVFITSEVALSYISYRTLQERIKVAEEGRDHFQQIKGKIDLRKELGVSSALELKLAEARYKASEAALPRLRQELEIARNRLAELTAMSGTEMNARLAKGSGIPTPPESISVGFPAELLRSRPDVRQSEREIARATAEVGVAEAELFPDLSISGALTYEFLRQGLTTTILDRVLGIGATLRHKVFRKCREQHRIKEFEAKLDQTILERQQVILRALRETEDSMTLLRYAKKRLGILENAAVASKEAADLMEDAYIVDEVDLQRMLNARQDYITIKDEQVATQGRRAMHSIRLFKALGGGELAGQPEYKDQPLRNKGSDIVNPRHKTEPIFPPKPKEAEIFLRLTQKSASTAPIEKEEPPLPNPLHTHLLKLEQSRRLMQALF